MMVLKSIRDSEALRKLDLAGGNAWHRKHDGGLIGQDIDSGTRFSSFVASLQKGRWQSQVSISTYTKAHWH